MNSKQMVRRMAGILHNRPLAGALDQSIQAGLDNGHVHLGGSSTWEVFNASLNAAIRDIESHPRGKLFRRFLEYGPPNPDDPQKLTSDGETILSDPECGQCVQFIFSHMINRFKGELAELLAIAPCLELAQELQGKNSLSPAVEMYFGETIQERRRVGSEKMQHWAGYAKGADGLLVEKQPGNRIKIHAVIEVKSMPLPQNKILRQIRQHLERLRGGLKLENVVWEPKQIVRAEPVKIAVVPSDWKISRAWRRQETKTGWLMVFPDAEEPRIATRIDKIRSDQWRVSLNWSREALEQAAYEMTFWYMSQVGRSIYRNKPLPKEWEGMTPEQAGYNSIKMMLYYVILRYISAYQGHRAIKLYNAYSYGYPLAVGAKDMLWPEDLSTQ